jgi:hypothetical protein
MEANKTMSEATVRMAQVTWLAGEDATQIVAIEDGTLMVIDHKEPKITMVNLAAVEAADLHRMMGWLADTMDARRIRFHSDG